MKSRANIKSHPLHPILVCFPIAFFTGTLILDILALILERGDLYGLARILSVAGILGAVAAAIPGIIDYRYTVPPQSSASSRAAKHGIINSTVLIIFILTFIFRHTWSPVVILACETVAVVLMCIAGWMGGTLVHRNQIGVDIRYANAGKWKEETHHIENGVIRMKKPQLKEGQMLLLHADGRRIVLGKSGERLVAFDDRCPHRGGSLAAGSLICGTVQCPWHGSQFSVESGALKAGPAKESLQTFAVTEEQDHITVLLEASRQSA